jgi:hypothetical protein
MKTVCATLLALGVMLSASAPVNAGDIQVSKVKVTGDASKGSVMVEFDLKYKADGPGDIVFLAVQAGQDKLAVHKARHTGDWAGHVKVKLETSKSVKALQGTKGAKPIPILVHACDVYDEHQMAVWIANHASYSKTVTVLSVK